MLGQGKLLQLLEEQGQQIPGNASQFKNLSNLTNPTLEGKLANEKISRLLVGGGGGGASVGNLIIWGSFADLKEAWYQSN
jgi:hypothetical protein